MADIDLTPPLATRLAYQHSQMAQGTYTQGGSQVFSHLVNPPETGVDAEEWSDEQGIEAGFVSDPDANDALLDTTRQRDGMRDIADRASGNYFPEDEE
jgi:hypothetical protein